MDFAERIEKGDVVDANYIGRIIHHKGVDECRDQISFRWDVDAESLADETLSRNAQKRWHAESGKFLIVP